MKFGWKRDGKGWKGGSSYLGGERMLRKEEGRNWEEKRVLSSLVCLWSKRSVWWLVCIPQATEYHHGELIDSTGFHRPLGQNRMVKDWKAKDRG
jgi:hypothetical protein